MRVREHFVRSGRHVDAPRRPSQTLLERVEHCASRISRKFDVTCPTMTIAQSRESGRDLDLPIVSYAAAEPVDIAKSGGPFATPRTNVATLVRRALAYTRELWHERVEHADIGSRRSSTHLRAHWCRRAGM